MPLISTLNKLKKSRDRSMFMGRCFGLTMSELLKPFRSVLSPGRSSLKDGKLLGHSLFDRSEELTKTLRTMLSHFGKILFSKTENKSS